MHQHAAFVRTFFLEHLTSAQAPPTAIAKMHPRSKVTAEPALTQRPDDERKHQLLHDGSEHPGSGRGLAVIDRCSCLDLLVGVFDV